MSAHSVCLSIQSGFNSQEEKKRGTAATAASTDAAQGTLRKVQQNNTPGQLRFEVYKTHIVS